MKTRHFTLLLSIIILFATACADDSFDYKHADKDDTITCDNAQINTPLLKEALYTFEDELVENHSRDSGNLSQGYSLYLSSGISGKIPDATIISEHTRNVVKQLKKEKGLWIIENGKYTFDYNSDFAACLGDNFLNGNLKTTYKALITTNSMSSRLFGAPLRTQIRNASRDRHLATFVALDMYYSRLMDVDFTNISLPQPKTITTDKPKPTQPLIRPNTAQPVDFNKPKSNN